MADIIPIRKTLGMDRMEQLRAFVEWEKKQNPTKKHIAEWALSEIERLNALLSDARKCPF